MTENMNGQRIPIGRVIDKLDALLSKNDRDTAGKLLLYWKNEAVAIKDRHGELAIENELVGYYRKQNDKENGLLSVKNALFLSEELGQGEMASGATVYINCATAYKAFGMAEDAIPLYEKAEKIYKKVLPSDDKRFGGLYNNMATTLVDLGREEDAERAYIKALSVMEKIPEGEAECAITYVNMAHMYEKIGKSEMTGECMKKAYAYLKSEYLPHNGYYAFVLEKCAPSFGYFGDTDAYEEFIKESKRIYEGT